MSEDIIKRSMLKWLWNEDVRGQKNSGYRGQVRDLYRRSKDSGRQN